MAETAHVPARAPASNPLHRATPSDLELIAETPVSNARFGSARVIQRLFARQPLLTHRHRSRPATPPETRRHEFQCRRPMPERRCIRFAWTRAQACEWQGWDALVARARARDRVRDRDAVCGFVRIRRGRHQLCKDKQGRPGNAKRSKVRSFTQFSHHPRRRLPTPVSTRASRSCRNPSPGAPSLRPMPEGRRIRLGTTPIVVCGFVRTQHGPHRPIKDTHA